MKIAPLKLLFIGGAIALTSLFFVYDLHLLLTFENLKAQQEGFDSFYQQNQMLTIGIYAVLYILVTALSLPGAAVMTLAGGGLFGIWIGVLVVSFASTIGATLAFLISRFILRDSVQKRFGDRLKSINAGVEKDGGFYLFGLRLVPIFPFFVINLLMGLTPMKTATYYLVSQVGMFPGTIVYVNAGTQLAKLESMAGILSPELIASFAVLGIFPLIAKKVLAVLNMRKVFSRFNRPKRFDYNLMVIGGGSAGLVSSYIAAAVKAKVALVEKHKMGGDCLNTGCVPSKALIRSAKMLSYAARAREFGFQDAKVEFYFAEVMERVQRVIQKVEPHDSIERYQSLGVDCMTGTATITSPFTVEVDGREYTTKNIIIATGAHPFVPPIKGIDQIDYLTSDNIWDLREQPEKLVVLGGGPIGSELTQAFARLGSKVTQVEMASAIMGREDGEVADMIARKFRAEGIDVRTDHLAKEVIINGDKKYLLCQYRDEELRIEFDQLLVAVGRVANVSGFGLEELGVELTERKTVAVDPFMRTNYPNIFCAGDVAGPYQFTHTAAHQAWYASVNALFAPLKSFKADYRVIPWATYTDPEVARVGLNETDAKAQGIEYETTVYGIDDLDRAIADEEDHGFVKVLTVPGKDKILGVTIVGPHASDIIAEYVLAMKQGIGLNKILGTIHIYPTLAEANKYAAGEWKRNHAPEGLLRWMEKFHAWRLK